MRQLLILAPWIWGCQFYAMALVPDHFTYILWICMHVENWMAIMILYLEFVKLVISTMYHFWNIIILMKITPAMYGKTYCAFRHMAWATALGNWLSVMIRMIVYYTTHVVKSIIMVSCMYILQYCTLHSEGNKIVFYYYKTSGKVQWKNVPSINCHHKCVYCQTRGLFGRGYKGVLVMCTCVGPRILND